MKYDHVTMKKKLNILFLSNEQFIPISKYFLFLRGWVDLE